MSTSLVKNRSNSARLWITTNETKAGGFLFLFAKNVTVIEIGNIMVTFLLENEMLYKNVNFAIAFKADDEPLLPMEGTCQTEKFNVWFVFVYYFLLLLSPKTALHAKGLFENRRYSKDISKNIHQIL